jgi:hypothetical protein
VEEELQNMIAKKDQCDYRTKGPYPRLQFINKYFLYSGLCQYYEEIEP